MSTPILIKRIIGSTLPICGVFVILLEHVWIPSF